MELAFPSLSLSRETKIIYETRDASKISSTRRFRSDSLVQQISLLIFLFFFFKFPHRYSYFFRFHIHIYTDIPSSSTEKIKRIHFETRIQIYIHIYKNIFILIAVPSNWIHPLFFPKDRNKSPVSRADARYYHGLVLAANKKKKKQFPEEGIGRFGINWEAGTREKTHVVDASLRNGECQRRHCQPWCSKLD